MLDAFIIEEIRRREQERESHRPSPQLPIPEPSRPAQQNETHEEDDAPQRGVVIIDYTIPASPYRRVTGNVPVSRGLRRSAGPPPFSECRHRKPTSTLDVGSYALLISAQRSLISAALQGPPSRVTPSVST